jgi:exodeoxyribonuclease III
LLCWNVNGLRATLGRTLPALVAKYQPDLLCLQETKAWAADVPDMSWAEGYHAYWAEAQKKGYSGTLTLSRKKPRAVTLGIGVPELDTEGRVVTLEYPGYYAVNVYTPNAKAGLERLEERTTRWDPAFLAYLERLDADKPVLACGDFNVAHKEIDIARPKANERNPGFTIEERTEFGRYIDAGFLDSFREFEPGPGHYTWWSMRGGGRQRNIGWRIDYVLASRRLRQKLKRAFIMPEITGSDHCPVGIELA